MSSTGSTSAPIHDSPASVARISLILLLAALAVGAALRFYHLDRQPQGIHPDEALYGYEGWSIMTTGCDYRRTGCPPLYLKGYSTDWDNRTSVLYPYLYSVLWRFLPMTIFFVRLPSVLIGLGVIVLTYLLGRRLFLSRPLVAGAAALLTALSPLAIGWSRVGHDPITVPFLTLVIALSILRTLAQPRWWLLAGLALAVGLYGYQPFKFVGPGVALLSLWYVKPSWTKQYRRWFIAATVLGGVVATPFLINQITNWSILQRQFNSISILRLHLGWLQVFWNVNLYLINQITNPATWLAFVPFAIVAAVMILWRSQRRTVVYCLWWLAIALVPVLITYWLPGNNEMQSRGLGITGPYEILAAAGIVYLIVRWRQWASRLGRTTAIGLLVVFMAGQILLSGLVNQAWGGWCCFVLGGMEQVANVVRQPPYADRRVVIERFHFMQGVNLLWTMKIPPRELQSPSIDWQVWQDNQQSKADVAATVGRFSFCQIDDCFRPGDGALYVVPADQLKQLPTVAAFDLHFYRSVRPWKIVDNAATD